MIKDSHLYPESEELVKLRTLFMEIEKYLDIYRKVLDIINPLYLVGGSVRDLLLNKEPKDYDFTTPLEPDEIEKAIKSAGRRAYLTGKRFGTLGVKIDGQLVEITTFRAESYRKGNRKPEVIFVTQLEEDLSRRDFTMNAIAIRDKNIIDPFNGKKDIENKIIRAVGIPAHRIKDDPLRMLRCARFISQLNFCVEESLARAKMLIYLLKNNIIKVEEVNGK